jgi:hypothetical protein
MFPFATANKLHFFISESKTEGQIYLLFAAGNNVEVDESLFQEMDDLELEDDEDDPDYNPADPGSDSTD